MHAEVVVQIAKDIVLEGARLNRGEPILIPDVLVGVCEQEWMQVGSRWTVRGGIHSVVTVEHGKNPLPH